jgi:hypothetical protein
MIKLFSKIGLTHDLRQISEEKILAARLRMDEKRLLQKIEKRLPFGFQMPPELVSAARMKYEHAHEQFLHLKEEYLRLKEKKLTQLHARMDHVKTDLTRARETLIQAITAWSNLCKSFGVKPTRLTVSFD